jgi:proton-coupled amino acid transporter
MTPGSSFSDIGVQAMGKKGKILVDITLGTSQIGFVCAYIYFIATSLKSVVDEAFTTNADIRWFGALCFVIYVPLCYVRRIERFAITHIFADALIIITTLVILVYAIIHC